MIEKAQQAAAARGLKASTHFIVGDVGDLPYPSNFFDRAISLNVGCNLPALEPHLKELGRVLKLGGIAIITAPTSFGTLFTNGQRSPLEIVQTLEKELLKYPACFPPSIQGMDEIYRATFAKKGEKWSLILQESELTDGEEIWRKIPKMAVPNHYHSEQSYLTLAQQAGFFIREIYRPHFRSKQEWHEYQLKNEQKLGVEYIDYSPFITLVLEKI